MMLLAQIVGLVGILLLVAIFQVNDRKTILWLQIASGLTWTVYYALMGAYTGAGLVFLGAVRCYLFANYRDKEWLLPMTIAALAIGTLITWEDWTSMLALMGMILASVALWQKDPRKIRMISLFIAPFWMTYNYVGGSYVGIAGDTVTFLSVVIGIVRFDIWPLIQQRKRRAQQAEVVESNLV